jgi:hypothetical protein
MPSGTDQLPSPAVVVDPLATVTGAPEALARWSVTVTETSAVLFSMLPLTVGENWVSWTCGSGSGLVVLVVDWTQFGLLVLPRLAHISWIRYL